MSQQVTTEILTAAELPAVRVFLATQNMLGQNAPAFTAPGVLALMAQLDTLSGVYSQVQNATMRGWIDTLYDDLASVATVYKQPFPALYIAYQLANFPFNPASEFVPQGYYSDGGGFFLGHQTQTFRTYGSHGNEITVTVSVGGVRVPAQNQTFAVAQYGVYPAFRQSCVLIYHQVVQGGGTYDGPGTATRTPWGGPPATPPRWNQAVNGLLQTWALTPPAAVIPPSTFDNYSAVQHAVLAPTAWTDVDQVKAGVASVWAAQVSEVRALLQPATLTADTYFFLLHVLVGLLTGDNATAALVEQIVTASATSQEYPNDTFINQLVYLALMYLGDPLGPYGWNNAQLQTALADLSSVVANVGPAAPLILTSLTQHQKLLYAAASYPLVDPYNPGIGFNQRKTDTMFALDKARASLHAALPVAGAPPVRIVRRTLLGGPAADTLTNDDLAAATALVALQGDIGATTPTKAGLFDFISRLANFSYWQYPKITNAALLRQAAAFYQGAATAPTNFGAQFPALLAAYLWGHFIENGDWYAQQVNWNVFRGGGHGYESQPPSTPAVWQAAVQNAYATLQGSATPGPQTLIYDLVAQSTSDPWGVKAAMVQYQYGLFDPARWTDVGQLVTAVAGLWATQASDLAALVGTTLNDQQCLALLLLLTGLCTSPKPQDLARVNTIASTVTSSTEYPNDTFIDQLVYFALMTWLDPKGGYQWTHDQLGSQVQTLLAAVPNGDPASVLLRKTFSQQAAVLNSSPSYPMVDPYNPAIGFPQRKTDTLAAINQAWHTIASATEAVGDRG